MLLQQPGISLPGSRPSVGRRGRAASRPGRRSARGSAGSAQSTRGAAQRGVRSSYFARSPTSASASSASPAGGVFLGHGRRMPMSMSATPKPRHLPCMRGARGASVRRCGHRAVRRARRVARCLKKMKVMTARGRAARPMRGTCGSGPVEEPASSQPRGACVVRVARATRARAVVTALGACTPSAWWQRAR